MCGFVGFTGLREQREAILHRMADRIIHRGPDMEGYHISGNDPRSAIALGFRRLSIIDLAAGKQPMYNEDGTVVCVFNGEIYNFMELRTELQAKGHIFQTHCDTEVILHGYEEYGTKLAGMLRGMFAFVVWDTKTNAMYGARDIFGIKPFYYTQTEAGELLFGSEIKSLLEHPGFRREVNAEALRPYLTFQYSAMNETFFKGTYKLPPAHWFTYKDGKMQIERYWDADFRHPTTLSYEQCADQIDARVRESVAAHRISDVKLGAFLSGGVDSSVCAAMLAKAIGKQLTCVFVDHGLLRKNEKEEVCSVFGPGNANGFDINFICVDARDRYFSKLKGVTEPERKRKIIGEEFIRVFEEEAKKIGKVDFLAQGTIYPDVVESGLGGESTVIKSHHNVGGLPDTVDFKELVEPLRNLFKDEVRQAGRELGLPEYLVSRQPFPGPGLGIRIIGEVTPEKVAIVQDADAIWREEIAKAGLDKEISQYYAALTNMHSVGVMGDERTYDYAVALRAVTTTDFMTAESYDMPWDVLGTVTSRIVNEVKHVNRVFYDCTGKPPATIELE
mgnify:CR=1 FL=1